MQDYKEPMQCPNEPKVYSIVIDGKKYIIEPEEPPS